MKRILIADDSGMARAFIQRALEMVLVADAEFIQAENGADALARIKAAPPDLVVSDLNMPEMDGTELLTRIIANPRLNHIPVIVITSLKNQARIEELRQLGAAAVLGKPLQMTDLDHVLAQLFPDNNPQTDGATDGFGQPDGFGA